ncbi:MAG: endo-1,4-beta-xylanase [Clostridia bacterium]|nr:endo-1,4-beta-xylanase [Clostridia bacterium]
MKEALENFRKSFEVLKPEIDANIEKYRKGKFEIRVVDKDGNPVRAKLYAKQEKHAFDFGTSVLMLGNMGEKEQAYRDAITNLFNFVTTTFCWGVMETKPGKFRFEEGSEEIYRRPPSDRVLRFAEENGMKAKGQPLFCGRWCPDWLPKDAKILKERWLKYVHAVAERYDGKFGVFDVVNESYEQNGSWSNMDWFPEPIEDFVSWMLKNAGEIFSDKCVLERNEATQVNYGKEALRYYSENKKLLEQGIRLDSIGFQFHFFDGKSCKERLLLGEAIPQNIYNTYQKMSSLHLPMYITEITIPTVYENMSREVGEEIQAEILDKLYRLWFSIPNMQGIVYWNPKDGDAWESEGNCRGCLIDENVRKKKSYYALENLIKREWNTSVLQNTVEGTVRFSGFYGEYDIEIETENKTIFENKVSFDKNTKTVTIVI